MYMHSRKSLRLPRNQIVFGLSLIFGVMSHIVLATPAALAAPAASATSHEPQCSSYYSSILQKSVEYCVDRSTPDAPYVQGEPVTYFMHGTNGNAHTWVKNNYAPSLETLRNYAIDSGVPLPPMTFVSFNTSPYSFFMDHPFDKNSAYETWLIAEFIPFIEHTLPVCDHKECRGIMGESMGGFGALKTILRHPDMFAAVAAESPALPPFSVRDSVWKWEWFFSHHTVGPIKGLLLIELVRHLMPNTESWNVQNPIYLTENFPENEKYPPIYFDMGGRDGYGFNVGYEILKGLFDQKSIPYTTIFEPTKGHDMWKRHAGDALEFILAHVGQTNGRATTQPTTQASSN
jgi:pimeloyl-ACP methyl ester carboxylesterase